MIILAVAENGGVGDPEKNSNVRLALELSKKNNMPKVTVMRAIDNWRIRNCSRDM